MPAHLDPLSRTTKPADPMILALRAKYQAAIRRAQDAALTSMQRRTTHPSSRTPAPNTEAAP